MRADFGPTANPYDPIQLCDYLDKEEKHSESTKLIWTVNLDLSPVYAIEAELAYAEQVYKILRSALRGESIAPEKPGDQSYQDYVNSYVARLSVPGVLTNRTVRLFSGQVVPVVVAQHRGMFTWNTEALTNAVIETVKQQEAAKTPPAMLSAEDEGNARMFIQNFLDKLYFQLRNLGQSSPDRALNFSATNVFQATEAVVSAIDPVTAGLVPAPKDRKGFYTLDTVSVSKSPYCRFDSDCWDVQLIFFDQVNVLQARLVFQFTIDVSDEMPVTMGPLHKWTQGQSALLS
jgi:cyanobactin maturation PatA/PatG family protease